MKAFRIFIASSLVAAVPSLSGADDEAPSEQGFSTLEVYEQQMSMAYADSTVSITMPRSDADFGALGDVFMVNNRLLDADPRQGEARELGLVRRACRRLQSTPLVEEPKNPFADLQRDGLCTMTYVFEGRGQIVAEGEQNENSFERGEPSTMAITGGTGEFVGARGEVTMQVLILPNTLLKSRIRLLDD